MIVAHSGAGVLMPLLAEQLSPELVVFVDAVVPGDGLSYQASDPFIEFVDSLSHDGPLLPPWHEWWGNDVTARLIYAARSRPTRHVCRDRSTTIRCRCRLAE